MGIYDELARLDNPSPTPAPGGSAGRVGRSELNPKRVAAVRRVSQLKAAETPLAPVGDSRAVAATIPEEPNEGRGIDRSDERTSEVSDERTNVRQADRRQIRHAFDIYEDQLLSLQELQLKAVQSGKRKPRLGRMVEKALDLLLDAVKRGKTKVY